MWSFDVKWHWYSILTLVLKLWGQRSWDLNRIYSYCNHQTQNAVLLQLVCHRLWTHRVVVWYNKWGEHKSDLFSLELTVKPSALLEHLNNVVCCHWYNGILLIYSSGLIILNSQGQNLSAPIWWMAPIYSFSPFITGTIRPVYANLTTNISPLYWYVLWR